MTKTILYVEDNMDNIVLVQRVVDNMGHKFLHATTGLDGLKLFDEHLPDLVLLDINLPDIDGYEVAQRLRRDSKNPAVPIIAITANALAGDSVKAINAGCNYYIPKPIKIGDLRRQIMTFLTL